MLVFTRDTGRISDGSKFHAFSSRKRHRVPCRTVRILKDEPLEPDASPLNAIAGFAFFGVPHRGLAVQCLVPLVKDNPNRALLESLNKNSSLLDRLQIEFDKISKARSLSVVSFYETEKSPTAIWVNGRWEMSGPSEVLVEVFSATCGCQKQHPINRNHSEMVKYSVCVQLSSDEQGKSFLMKFAVDAMNRRKSGEIIAPFFIHGRGTPLQRTPLLIEGTKDQSVVIFVDALDECGEEDAKRLLVSLKSLIENARHEESLVRICFSSRHFPILGHETMARVYVEEKNDQDIRLVIEGRLKELQPVEKRQEIEKEIMLKAHGGFQWAMLITNMILDEDATGARTEDLLNMISTIPPDLDDLYDFILRGATKDKHKQMEKLFQWVVYTKRPLSAQELREALATDQEMTYTTVSELRARGNWSDCVSQFEMRVRHISRGLVEFQNRDVYEQYEPGGEEWSREAQFIHQSAADFVAQKFLTNIEEGSLSRSPAGSRPF
uniref:Nephrocystin 3-like N-terminal domain-containing protein n=1 Tax=Fusarium oxysporum (strain Fo5176) TaxID=660025 RepID=A0A0C4DIJ2_FUSOF